MTTDDAFSPPRGWTKTVRSSVLHAISVAFAALTRAWGAAATSRLRTTRLQADLDRAATEIALLKKELAIKDARWRRVRPRRRPHYSPTQRMRILQLKAARGWSSSQVARVFAVTKDTIVSWLQRVDEQGEHALVQLTQPVNRFPDYVGCLVRWLKAMCLSLGKLRIAQVLARAGLRLGATTVGRMLKDRPRTAEACEVTKIEEDADDSPISVRVVNAKYPDHVWALDLTVIPTAAGFWVPWSPFSKLQRWPFCWWVAVVLDHFSRRVSGFALFATVPTSADICAFLDRLTKRIGAKPKHIITDKGRQFFCETFKSWCRARGVRPRFGAVGKHGSIAVIERFFRSMKTECTRQTLVPFGLEAMRRELSCYATWYNEHRPHQSLAGMTPAEVYNGSVAGDRADRFEPRLRSPLPAGSRQSRAPRIHVVVRYLAGRRHLPVVELKRAA